MNWNTTNTTKTLLIDGHIKKDGTVSLVNDFETWKLSLDHLPTVKEAWDEQQVTINDLQSKLIIAGNTLKRARQTINDLKAFTEENLRIMDQLERENIKLKEGISGRED